MPAIPRAGRCSPYGRPSMTAAVRVVIADDNVDLRDVLRLSLELAGGFEVVGEAGDAFAAIDLTEVLRPDVLLVDRWMPGGERVDVLATVRRQTPGVGVVVLTGWLVEGERERLLADGADGYLMKGPELFGTVGSALRSAVRVDVEQ
ncbi:MAG: cheY [Actinomycetia bacterium]|nr:cheY [Actinomycetes bacterium]